MTGDLQPCLTRRYLGRMRSEIIRNQLKNRGRARCWVFGAAARREEKEYPSWIFERRATLPQRQRFATLWAEVQLVRLFCILTLGLTASSICFAADPVAELASFSVFDKV